MPDPSGARERKRRFICFLGILLIYVGAGVPPILRGGPFERAAGIAALLGGGLLVVAILIARHRRSGS